MATLLQSTTIGGHSAIHAGNIGSQSVNYANSAGSTAWTNVSGRPTALSQFTNDLGNYGNWITSAALANYLTTSQVTSSMISGLNNMLGVTSLPYSCDIVVEGDQDTYYPVHLIWGDQDVWRRIVIKRGYGEEAPWDPIGTGSHHGGLLLDWEGNFGGWGGADYSDRLRVFQESYTTICADMYRTTHSMGYTFFLRGGGAVYHIFSDQTIRGYQNSSAPDIAYDTDFLFYDSAVPEYRVYAPAPVTTINSSRIDGLRTKKQSQFDGRYLRQGVDISGISNITTSNNISSLNFLASNAYYLNGQSYYLNSSNGGIYTNARFESGTSIVAPGGNSSEWNTAYGWGNHASAGYQAASTAITTSNIGSQSVSYAATAGSAPNAGNINQFYNVNSGDGNGLRFWGGSDSYKISMGVGELYQYGPVADYSIKMQMNDSSTDRGFTWGRISHAPIAALNSTSGDMQIAGSLRAAGHLFTSYNGNNILLRSADNGGGTGILLQNSGGSFKFQIYGNGTDYGFLNGDWAAWDIRKAVSGAMYMNNDSTYYLQTNSTSNFVALNIEGNAVVHAGNIGSQSVSYATTAGSVAWTNVSGRPTALSQFTNDLVISTTDNTKLPLAGGTMSGRLTLKSISGVEQTVPNDFGAYLHLGDWGVGRTDAGAVLVNTAYRADYATDLFDMNISRFTNDSGYITSSGSISGNAATATYATSATRLYASDSPYRYGDSSPYYMEMRYDGTYWNLSVTPATPSAVRVAYANSSGTASQVSIDYNNDSNANYQLLWGSGNSVYGTGDVYVNPSSNVINARGGFISNSNPWSTANSAFFPNGITTAGSDNWIYGHTYIGNAPGNGNGHEFWADGNMKSTGHHYLDANYGQTIVGRYSSTVYQGVWAMGDSYKLPMDGSTTGSLYGLAWSHPNAGGVAGNLNTHGLLVMENGTFLAAVSGSIRARDDMRAPYFYGSGSIRVGDMWGGAGLYLPSGHIVFGTEGDNWVFSSAAETQAYISGGDGNLWMRWAGDWLSNLLAAKQDASTAINTSNIGSQSVAYASSAGSAPNASNLNASYGVTAGAGNGLKFWGGSDIYKISMGNSDEYHYGPVTDYSIKTVIDSVNATRGFTWGVNGVTPIAGLNAGNGNMQIAGTFTASNFSGSSSGTNTGDQTNISGNAATATNVAYSGLTGTVPTWNQDTTGNSNTTSQRVFSDLKINFPSGAGNGHSFGANHYSMGLDSGNGGWDGPHYRDVIIGYHTGVRIGAHYSGIRFYNNSPTTDANNDGNGDGGEALLMTVGGYVGTENHTDVVVNNNLFANASMRAPIFYDSQDTTYFLDPNGQSRISRINISEGQVQASNNAGGRLRISSFTNGESVINGNTHNIVLGPYSTRTGASLYYAGIAINGLMNYTGSTAYDVAPHIWLGGYYRDTPGSERSDFVVAVKSGTGISGAGSDLPEPRFRVDYEGIASATGSFRAPIFYDSDDTEYYADFNSTSNSAIRVRGGMLMGPNPTWGAYLQVGGNGNESAYATVTATNGNLHLDSADGYGTYINHYSGGTIYFGTAGTWTITGNGSYYNGTAATAGNATTAGGLYVHNNRNNEANKIVRTDANGYIQAGWINTTSGAFSGGINKIYCSDDDYMRYQTPANFISNLGLITTSNIASQSVNYASSAGNADTVDSLHASSFVRKDTSGQYLKAFYEYGSYLTSERPVDLVDQGLGGGGLRVDFMHPSYTGSGGWNHIITWSGYNGYNMYQLGGHYDGGTGTDLWVRSEANHGRVSWTAWRRLLNTASDPYAVNMNQYVRTTDNVTFAILNTTGAVNIDRHIDANSTWGGCRSIFVGWSSGKVILGNGNSGGHDYALNLGCDTVVSTNPFFCFQDITAFSDARVKENVEVVENAIEKIKAIRGVTFTRNDVEDKNKRHAGVIAQEILAVLPEAVSEDLNGHYSVAYGNLNALLIEAIKEQQKEIDELKAKLN